MTQTVESAKAAQSNGMTATQQRTYQLLIRTAHNLMARGATPTVAELAQAAGVSRATAYRYFPSQEAIVLALAEATNLPIRYWNPEATEPRARLHELLDFTFEQLRDGEVHHRAILQMHLANWEKSYPEPPPPTRGHRRELLCRALEPLRHKLDPLTFEHLVQGLSPFFGIELFIVFRDMWGLEDNALKDRAHWVIEGLLQQAMGKSQIDPV